MFAKIRKWYQCGLWTAAMVEAAAGKGVISEEQAAEITGA